MERIQAAIENARKRRMATGDSLPKAAPAARPAPAIAALPQGAAAWQAIPAYEPAQRALEKRRVLTYTGGVGAAPFEMMRTKVLQQMKSNGWRRLAITSPQGSNGKTTLTANLAFALARQAGTRVAAIEMDLRRPALAETIGMKDADLQFSRVLEGKDEYPGQMRRVGDNLVFGTNRQSVSRPAELLQSDRAAAALSRIESELELTLMLFDMPPMLVSDDMLAFSGRVDCALLVAAAESTTIKEIDRCERDLAEQTNVLGVVLNKCRYTEDEYGY
jgi:Mrp family chromosome partitioning ATPase